MDRRLLVVVLALLAVLGYHYIQGFEWHARFPNDWRYYIDINLPSYSSDHPVVELNLPTTLWVKNGWLKPDCSDLRFTSDSDVTEPYDYAIVHPFAATALRLTNKRNGSSGRFTISSPVPARLVFFARVESFHYYSVRVKDLNTGKIVKSVSAYKSRYTQRLQFSVDIEPHHVYEVDTSSSEGGQYERHVWNVSSDPPFHARGTVAGFYYLVVVVEPKFGPGDNYCAEFNATVLVKVPPGTRKLRVWFGSVGNADYVVKSVFDIARQRSLSLTVGQQNFDRCASYRSCGADTHCWANDSGTWGIFRYSKHYGGTGDDYYRGYNCHGKRWYDYDTYACTSALNGGDKIVYAVSSDRDSGCCVDFTRENATVTLTPNGNYYLYGLLADQLKVWSSYEIDASVKGTIGLSYVPGSRTYTPFYWYCIGGKCFSPTTYVFTYGYHYRNVAYQDVNGYASPDIQFQVRMNWHDICWVYTAGVSVQNLREVYLLPSDVIHLSVSPDTRPNEYSVPPSIVLSGPEKVYWGQEATYTLTGSFASSRFIVEPFGELNGPSITVEWNRPGVYHLTAVAYNDKGTPSWIEKDINVLNRSLELNLMPLEKPYVHEPFHAKITVRDVLGDPVNATISIESCQPCEAINGECTTTCTVYPYGDVQLSASADADDSLYVDYNGTVSVHVYRYDTEFRDVHSTIVNNNVVIEGYLWDTRHDAPVAGVPVNVSVYDDQNLLASGTFYTQADGRFRVYLASAKEGNYTVEVSFPGDCNYAPVSPVSFIATFRAPSRFELNYPEVNVPVPPGALVEGNTIIIRETEISSPVLASPETVTRVGGGLSVIPAGYANLLTYSVIGLIAVYVVFRVLMSL